MALSEGGQQTDEQSIRQRGWRRRLRFSVRSLLLVVTLAALYMGWLENRIGRQRAAVERIMRLGGHVGYDFEIAFKTKEVYKVDKQSLSPYPRWLLTVLDAHHFHDVVYVNLADTSTGDEDLRLIGQLSQTEYLALNNTKVTGAGMKYLSRLPELQILHLWNTRVDDQGLADLAAHPKLVKISLANTAVTDQGLSHLPVISSQLFGVLLADNNITDDGLVHLHGLKHLEYVSLAGTRVSSVGVERLLQSLPHMLRDSNTYPKGVRVGGN